MDPGSTLKAPRQLGRYAIYGQVGAGGMATVHFGRLLGPSGFARPVAIKRLHENLAADREFVDMLIDEAHTASRIQHVNVVPTIDVISDEGELWLVMEFVNGESLARLLDASRGDPMPVPIAAALLTGVLHGLHAAHETRSESGELLGIVHRDVSPDNVLVGIDGVPRLADFGVAKARGRLRTTPAGQVKGKLAYMSCEQLRGRDVDRRADVYGAGVVLWEALTGKMLFDGASEGEVIQRVLGEAVPPPSRLNSAVPSVLDQVALRALSREPDDRFTSAREMASAIESSVRVATQTDVVDWMQRMAGASLTRRSEQLRAMVDAGPTRETTPLDAERPRSSTRRLSEPVRDGSGHDAHDVSKVEKRQESWPLLLAVMICGLLAALWWFLQPKPIPAAPVRQAERSAPAPPPPVEVRAPAALELVREETPAPVAPKKEHRGPRRTREKAKKDAPEVDCSPPYYLDADGIRRVKRACL